MSAVAIEGHKPRALLAILLVHANEVVPPDRLIDELWGETPPPTAGKTLQAHISRLRRSLDGTLETRGRGYVLRVEPGRLDAHAFEELLEQARRQLAGGRPAAARDMLERALGLWRGPALADFAYEPLAQAEIARLEELQLAAHEERIEADLQLGRHAELLGELRSLVARHPLRERLRAQLMLALYRSDRQAEALQALRAEAGRRRGHRLLPLLLLEPPDTDRQPGARRATGDDQPEQHHRRPHARVAERQSRGARAPVSDRTAQLRPRDRRGSPRGGRARAGGEAAALAKRVRRLGRRRLGRRGHRSRHTHRRRGRRPGDRGHGRLEPARPRLRPLRTPHRRQRGRRRRAGGAAPPGVGDLLRDLRARLGAGTALVAGDGFAGFEEVVREAGRAADGLYVINAGLPAGRLSREGRRLLGPIRYRGSDGYFIHAAQAAEILLDAIERSDGTRRSITDELLRTRIEDGLIGDVSFDGNGDVVQGPVTVFRITGRRAVVDRVVTVGAPRE